MPGIDFIEEILKEAEAQEEKRTEAYYDLQLIEVRKLQQQIEKNFHEAELEVKIINDWAIQKNAALNERLLYIERKLECFIREQGVKTIDLPNGILKMHRKPDKVEVSDMETFLKHAKPEMLAFIPEQIKPDLNKIKAFIKQNYTPAGVTVTEGKEEFNYKIKEVKDYV